MTTDMTQAQDKIKQAQSLLEEVARELESNNAHMCEWIPSTQTPGSDDERVIVETTSGSIYFSRTINGKFMKEVKWWCRIPNNKRQ